MSSHVLVAEDDANQAELVRRYLEREQHTVTVVGDGRAALVAARTLKPALIVLDVMLPSLSGVDVCRLLRHESDVPVIMLTARSTEDDLVLGLDAGADDYLTKPFSPRELAARVRTLLRRTAPAALNRDVLSVGELVIDVARHSVQMRGVPVQTTPAEFRLLEVMASRPEHTLSRAQLLSHLHGIDRYVTTRTIDGHVMNLRRKIELDATAPRYLLTVYGVGYRLVCGAP